MSGLLLLLLLPMLLLLVVFLLVDRAWYIYCAGATVRFLLVLLLLFQSMLLLLVLFVRLLRMMMLQFSGGAAGSSRKDFSRVADAFSQLPLWLLRFHGSTSVEEVSASCCVSDFTYNPVLLYGALCPPALLTVLLACSISVVHTQAGRGVSLGHKSCLVHSLSFALSLSPLPATTARLCVTVSSSRRRSSRLTAAAVQLHFPCLRCEMEAGALAAVSAGGDAADLIKLIRL